MTLVQDEWRDETGNDSAALFSSLISYFRPEDTKQALLKGQIRRFWSKLEPSIKSLNCVEDQDGPGTLSD